MSATQTTPYPWYQTLPRLGTDEEFAALRGLLLDTGYTDKGICERLKVEDLQNYSADSSKERIIEVPLDALVRLFFDCALVEEEKIARVLPAGAIPLLGSLDLIVRHPDRPGMVYGSVAILLAGDVVTVCDRGKHGPDGTEVELPPDVVYPAILATTRRFLDGLPVTPCGTMLDVGTGTGIAALLGARAGVGHVWASDITSRAVRFAEFNRRLAGLENMTVVEGSLYEPVEGLTFDRITIHPPYVPAKKSKFVFRDAGQDGEQVIRGAIEGLPDVLRPGGRFYSLQISTDRDGEMLEQRVRKWLGPKNGEFDVMVGAHSIRTPSEFFSDSVIRRSVNFVESRDLHELWEETKTKYIVYCAVLIERHERPRPPITGRIQTGKGYTGRHLDWLLDWQKAVSRADAVEMMMGCRPTLAPDGTLHVTSHLHEGRFVADEFTVKSGRPFRSSFQCQAWVTEILSECDGVKTWADHYEHARAGGYIPAGVPAKEFSGLLSLLVSLGILRLANWELPPADGADDEE